MEKKEEEYEPGEPGEVDIDFESLSLEGRVQKIDYKLYPHQEEGIRFIEKREAESIIRGGILSMEMGMGKTLTMLSHIMNEKKNKKECGPTLVCCPKTALITWMEEIQTFFGNSCNVIIFRKENIDVDKIELQILMQMDIVLVNYEYIRSIVTKYNAFEKIVIRDSNDRCIGCRYSLNPIYNDTHGEKTLLSIKWNRIVADESHNFSNFKTSLFQSMMCLTGTNKWCLSGTPIRNYSDDLYAQFKFIGYRDLKYDLKKFRSHIWTSYIFYLTYEKANIKLPNLVHHRINCKLEGYNEKIYSYYLNKADEAFQSYTIGTKTFAEVLTLFLRLRQVCVAPYTVTPNLEKLTLAEENAYEYAQKQLDKHNEGLGTWINDIEGSSGLCSPKIVETVKIIKSIPEGEKVIVFTMFKKVISILEKACKDLNVLTIHGDVVGKERATVLNTFKYGNCNILFISYKIGAESLNLTQANHILLLEPWWCPAVINQAKARVQRLGQKKDVTIYECYIGSTPEITSIEEAIIEYCDKKETLAKEFYLNGQMKEKGSLDAKTLGLLLARTKCKPKPFLKN
jgi:SNF2 family DNA or RNA helicase